MRLMPAKRTTLVCLLCGVSSSLMPGLELLQSAATWQTYATDLRAQIGAYIGGAAGAAIELVVTENNAESSNHCKQSTSLVTGLYRADAVAQLMGTEFNALLWWDLRNSKVHNSNLAGVYGWRAYGDYGMLIARAAPNR